MSEVVFVEVMPEIGVDHEFAVDFDIVVVSRADMPEDMGPRRDILVEIIHAAGPVEHGGSKGRELRCFDSLDEEGKVGPFDRGELTKCLLVVQKLDKKSAEIALVGGE